MKKTAQGHTGVHPRPCSPSVTQVLTTGCDSPPRFRATPEAIPGAPAGPKIELHCHRRHPGDTKRPGANSRWLSKGAASHGVREASGCLRTQEAGQEAPLGGHQTGTLAAPQAGSAWPGGAVTQVWQTGGPQRSRLRPMRPEEKCQGDNGALTHKLEYDPQLQVAPRKGTWQGISQDLVLPIDKDRKEAESPRAERPGARTHGLHTGKEPSPAPQLAGAAQEVTGAQCPPEASTNAAGGGEPAVCV